MVAAALTCAAFQPAAAQSWVPWYQPSIYDRGGYAQPQRSEEPRNSPSPFAGEGRRGPGPKLLDGGGRPSIAPISPEKVAFAGNYAPGTIVIDSSGRRLYLVQSKSSALRYPISVGREGFSWTGRERISRVADWPDWHPPKEMRERDRSLPEKMTGGVRNPLGAKALYLGNSLYRIHGTNSAQSIGRANSSGCFRLMNGHVVDVARRVGVGTHVVVLKGLPSRVARSTRDDD
jgi:lipoprotein-anchoring transpeptidase ErfK/SrfK